MKSTLIAAFLGLNSLSVMAAEAPFKVNAGPSNAGELYTKIYVTSHADSLLIKKITGSSPSRWCKFRASLPVR